DVDRTAGNAQEALLGALVEHRLLAARNLHHDRAPQVVALGRLGNVAFLAGKQAFVVELLEDDRGVAFFCPDLHRAAAAPALGGVQAEQAQQARDAVCRDVADERDVQQIASCSSAAASAIGPSCCVG